MKSRMRRSCCGCDSHDFSLSSVVIRLGSAANGRFDAAVLYWLEEFSSKLAVAPAQHTKNARRTLEVRPVSLLGKDPLHQGPEIGIGNAGVGRHRNLSPHALAAFFHLVDELGFGRLVAAVLGGDLLVGGTDQLLVHGVAGEAAVLPGKLLVRPRGQRGSERRDAKQEYGRFHGLSLNVLRKSTRSLMGSRQLTPRHSHPLTGSGRGGLSRAGGRPGAPSAIASTVVSGRNSRASSACQPASASGFPRSTRRPGGCRCSSSAIAIAP